MSGTAWILGGPVVIEAVLDDAVVVERFRLDHGVDPVSALASRGLHPRAVLGARRDGDPLVLTLTVESGAVAHPAKDAPQRRPSDLVVGVDETPVRVQRVAAYACVVSERGLLATQYSRRVAVPGLWGLPGGGIDAGEDPAAGLLRECREESGQDVVVERLHHLDSDHWIGRAPRGIVEDFHAVRLLYVASCPEPTDPVVEEADGTTAAARWVPLDEVGSLPWSAVAARQLGRFGWASS